MHSLRGSAYIIVWIIYYGSIGVNKDSGEEAENGRPKRNRIQEIFFSFT